MAKARNISNVNKIILDEIDKIKADQNTKQMLKDVLDLELENMDKERVQFKNDYRDVFLRHGY